MEIVEAIPALEDHLAREPLDSAILEHLEDRKAPSKLVVLKDGRSRPEGLWLQVATILPSNLLDAPGAGIAAGTLVCFADHARQRLEVVSHNGQGHRCVKGLAVAKSSRGDEFPIAVAGFAENTLPYDGARPQRDSQQRRAACDSGACTSYA